MGGDRERAGKPVFLPNKFSPVGHRRPRVSRLKPVQRWLSKPRVIGSPKRGRGERDFARKPWIFPALPPFVCDRGILVSTLSDEGSRLHEPGRSYYTSGRQNSRISGKVFGGAAAPKKDELAERLGGLRRQPFGAKVPISFLTELAFKTWRAKHGAKM